MTVSRQNISDGVVTPERARPGYRERVIGSLAERGRRDGDRGERFLRLVRDAGLWMATIQREVTHEQTSILFLGIYAWLF
jgi:hypothetical protein